ncbi:hypothetical protein [Picosynechococcus sp. NKBG15041c]|uniref:hypothetical protein n=1 Tax=Picosynechococcus sp. NKBG15041c TaxID=1407650 RepID=UPI00040ADFA8|nr:hypothetical protein [Picosynechococcus sp. NKBG15041c]
MAVSAFPMLQRLSNSIPLDGAVRLDLVEGVLIFRASVQVQARVEVLLEKQQFEGLTEAEEEELDCYEEIDDYLSFVNRTVRNAAAGSMVA